MPLTSILKNRRIFCVCFDISRTAAQIPTKLWEVNPKTLSFDLITKETISVEWLLTSNRIKLFFNVFFWYILFLSMDFFRSTCNQTRIFFFNFCADFDRSSGCHFEAILEDRIWHKISKKNGIQCDRIIQQFVVCTGTDFFFCSIFFWSTHPHDIRPYATQAQTKFNGIPCHSVSRKFAFRRSESKT